MPSSVPGRVVVDVEVGVVPAVVALEVERVARRLVAQLDDGAVDGGDQLLHLRAHEVLALVAAAVGAGGEVGVGPGDVAETGKTMGRT